MRYFVAINGREHQIYLGPDGTQLDGEVITADLARVEGTDVRHLLLDGRSYRLVAHREPDGTWDIQVGGRRVRARAVDERTHTIEQMTGGPQSATGPKPVRAPMPGMVVKVAVEEGDRVEAGQGVVIVEAMKMENELKAEGDAVVKRVAVSPGQTVNKDDLLIELAPIEAGEGAGENEEDR